MKKKEAADINRTYSAFRTTYHDDGPQPISAGKVKCPDEPTHSTNALFDYLFRSKSP